jgi:WD40 repeat protein/IPT/TIG domain-containing protein
MARPVLFRLAVAVFRGACPVSRLPLYVLCGSQLAALFIAAALGTPGWAAAASRVPPAPRLARLDPSSVLAGSQEVLLQIEGEDFTQTCKLRIGETEMPTTWLSPGRLQAKIPASLLKTAGSLGVVVTEGAAGGGTSNEVFLAVVNPTPRMTVVEAPLIRAGGAAASLIIRGSGFRQDSQIQVAGTALETQYRTESELTAMIPRQLLASAGKLTVSVMTPSPGGGASVSALITVLPALPGRFVVFTSNRRGGRNHIFLLDREGGKLDPLEEANSQNANDGYPTISADGRFIVFQSDRNHGQYDIFLFDRDKRALDPLPELNHPAAFDGFPRISANGRFIVFESDRLNAKPKIFLFDRESRLLSELNQANDVTADDGLAAISN